MNRSELLDAFCEVATEVSEEGSFKYWDPVEQSRAGLDFFNTHLYWLDRTDKTNLMEIWKAIQKDPRDMKILFNSIKVLKDKYESSET